MALHLSNRLKLKAAGSYELRQRLRRALFWACLLASPLFLGLIAGWVFGIRLNLTPSLPLGFYITTRSLDANLVEFCPQGAAATISLSRQYRTAGACPDGGAPLLKPAVAFTGDRVQVSADGIRVNGQLLRNSAGRFRDHLQRPLDPWPYGTYNVEQGDSVGRLLVQQLQLRQPLLRPHSRIVDSAPSTPTMDVCYGSSSTVALSFLPLPPPPGRSRGAAISARSLFPSLPRYSSITRNPERTHMLRCSATTRPRAGHSSPERAPSLESRGPRSLDSSCV